MRMFAQRHTSGCGCSSTGVTPQGRSIGFESCGRAGHTGTPQLLLGPGKATGDNILGAGMYGLAIALDDRTVVKFTTSEYEYETAQKLQGRRFRNVWSVYATGRCNEDTLAVLRSICGRDSRIGRCNKVFFIIGERLYAPPGERRVKAFRGHYGRAASAFARRVNDELRKAFPNDFIRHNDVHGGNVLLRNGRKMVAFDVQ